MIYINKKWTNFVDLPNQAQITNKLKQIRLKYRKAVNEGRKSGNGRIVHIYFELCERIWGGSPATEPVTGVETEIPPSTPSTSSSVPSTSSSVPPISPSLQSQASPQTPSSSADNTDLSQENNRRDLLDDQLRNHKGEKLKRKLSSSQQAQNNLREELDIKRRMIERFEDMEKKSEEQVVGLMSTFNRMAASLEMLVKCQTQQQMFNPPNTQMFNPPNAQQVFNPPNAQHNMFNPTPTQSNPPPASTSMDFSGMLNHLRDDQL